jgi:hypothetical protein
VPSRFESEPNPGEGDVGVSGTPAMKMLAFIRGALDDGTASMEVEQLVGRRMIVLERRDSHLPIGRNALLRLRDETDIGRSGRSCNWVCTALVLRG